MPPRGKVLVEFARFIPPQSSALRMFPASAGLERAERRRCGLGSAQYAALLHADFASFAQHVFAELIAPRNPAAARLI